MRRRLVPFFISILLSAIVFLNPISTSTASSTPIFSEPAFQLALNEDSEDTTVYQVVVNHEEQYSIWPADREIPPGWRPVGKVGYKDECIDYIKEVWTDMRPLSLRKKMEEMERQKAAGA